MQKVPIITGVLAAAGIFVAALAVSGEGRAQDGGLAVGVQGAFTEFDGSIGGDGSEENGVGGGLVVRYTTPIGTGMVAGVQASWSFTEGAEWSETLSYSEPGYSLSGTVTAEIDWSADLLARIGFDIGDAIAYVAGGLAFAKGEVGVTGTEIDGNTTTSASLSDSGSYFGYKLAAGVDLPIGETLETFIQLEYADYGDANYFELFDLEVTALAVRTGLLYRF